MATSSIQRQAASGSTAVFSVPFPYLDKSHVQVRVAGVLKTFGVDYTWPTSSTIQLTAGNPVAGTIVERRRITPVDPLTVFQPGNLDSGDLNVAELQPLYVAQEASDDEQDRNAAQWSTPGTTPGLPGTGGTIEHGVEDNVLAYDAAGNIKDSGTSIASMLGLVAIIQTLNAFWLAVFAVGTYAEAWLVLKLNGSLSTRALIKALTPQDGMSVLLTEPGRIGNFVWRLGDYSAQIALDTAEGMFLKANSVASSVGAWVRDVDIAKPEMWGAVGAPAASANSAVPDEYAALQCMLNVVGYTGGKVMLTRGKKFGTGTALFARITRQQAAPKALVADIYISDKSSFEFFSDGSAWLVAKAAMTTMLTFQYNSGVVGGVTNSRSPDQSQCYGIMFDGNSLAVNGVAGDYARGLNIHDNTIFDVTSSCITWTGSAAGYVSNNILKAPVGVACVGGAGGDLKIGPNQYFFPLAGGRAIKIQDSGNIVVVGGTVNSESIASVIGVDIEATSGHSVRHVTVRDMEFSGCQIGVYGRTASAAERIYGLVIDGCHTTSGSGFDRTSINPGTLVDLQRCDEVSMHNNLANGRALSVASQTAYLFRECRDVIVEGALVENYTGEACYMQGCDNVVWNGGSVRDVAQGGTSSAIFDLDGSTNCQINPASVVQTNAGYGLTGIIERAGSSGNKSTKTRWSHASSSFVASSKTGATDGYFRRFPERFAEGKVVQTAGGATLSLSNNCTAARASIGRVTVTFATAHPNTSYRVNATGVGCKVEVESVAAGSFVILMLDLADSPVDSTCLFEVLSAL